MRWYKVKYYTLKQVSEMILTPIPYIRKLIKGHKLKGWFIGIQYIVSDIVAFLFKTS